MASLAARHTELTQDAILAAAVSLLEEAPFEALSVRAVARRAGMAERTVFRHHASREALLDAVAAEMSRRLRPPPPPDSIAALLSFPQAIYARFEETATLTKAALHSELYPRIRRAEGDTRGAALKQLIDRAAPDRPDSERRVAAANIHYHLIATTWHYYRFYFGFSLEEATRCAQTAVVQALRGLGVATEL